MRTIVAILLPLFFVFTTLAQSGENSAVLLKKGITLHDKGDYAGAIKVYDEILKTEPENIEVLYEKHSHLFNRAVTRNVSICVQRS